MFRPRHSPRLLTLLGTALLLTLSHAAARAQIQFEPATSGFATELKVWTSAGITYSRVRLAFPNTGHRVSDWGQAVTNGNQITIDAKAERCLCGSGQAITFKENIYTLGALSPGTYTLTFKSYGVTQKAEHFDPSQVPERWEPTTLSTGQVGLAVWTDTDGLSYTRIMLYFPDTGYAVLDWGQFERRGNQFAIDLKVEKWTGDSQARTTVVDRDFQLGALAPGSYTLVIKIYGTTLRTQPFTIYGSSPKILTEEDSGRAIAFDSVTWMRLFPLVTEHNFSADRRARIMLFMTGAELRPGENSSVITARAEDSAHNGYTLAVEYVGRVPGYDWLTQVIAKPPDELKDGGDLTVTVSVRGVPSNSALVSIRPSASR